MRTTRTGFPRLRPKGDALVPATRSGNLSGRPDERFDTGRARTGRCDRRREGNELDAQTILQLLQDGGLTVYPLGVGSILSLAILIERMLRFRGLETGTRSLTRATIEALVRRDLETARSLCEKSKLPISSIYLEAMRWRNIALEDLEGVLATSRQEIACGHETRTVGDWHHRLPGALRRPVRHRGRHHDGLPGHGRARSGRLRGRRGGHLRGAGRHGRRPVRRHRGADVLQLPPGAGRATSRRPTRARASVSCRRCCTWSRRASPPEEAKGRLRVGASFRPSDEENLGDGDRRGNQHHAADRRLPGPAGHLHGHHVGDPQPGQADRSARRRGERLDAPGRDGDRHLRGRDPRERTADRRGEPLRLPRGRACRSPGRSS